MPLNVRNNPLFNTPKNREKPKPRKWSIFRILGKSIRRACTTIGALILISAIFSGIMAYYFSGQNIKPLPDEMVLLLPVEGPFLEREQTPSIQDPFPSDQLTIRQVTEAMRQGKDDDRVKGVVIALRSGGINLTHIQEIRAAIKDFQESGKFVLAYSMSFGDTGNSFGGYYLAAAADEIWMQPVGSLAITGLSAELPFGRAALEKLGITPQFVKRKEYKSAAAPAMQSDLDPATKEMMTAIITDLGGQFVEDVAKDRNLSEQTVKDLIDVGVFLDKEAIEAGLIDRLAYGDTLVDEMNTRISGDKESRDAKFISMDGYLGRALLEKKKYMIENEIPIAEKPAVALIYVNGAIVPRTESVRMGSFSSAITGPQFAAANKISEAIFDASKRDDIKAIIVRVNSPGGSPAASESIRRAIVRAKERGKKVIISMGATAASGGYWVSPDADKIFAMPATLTGSIGVVGGKFVLKDMWEKLNINWAQIAFGESAGMWSMNEKFDQAELARFEAIMDNIYTEFVSRVAQGRDMEYEQAEKIARGRAWTGRQALEIGLVDALGGLDLALDETAKLIGEKTREDIRVIELPRKKTLQEKLIELLRQQVTLNQFISDVTASLSYGGAGQFAVALDRLTNPARYAVYSDLEIR